MLQHLSAVPNDNKQFLWVYRMRCQKLHQPGYLKHITCPHTTTLLAKLETSVEYWNRPRTRLECPWNTAKCAESAYYASSLDWNTSLIAKRDLVYPKQLRSLNMTLLSSHCGYRFGPQIMHASCVGQQAISHKAKARTSWTIDTLMDHCSWPAWTTQNHLNELKDTIPNILSTKYTFHIFSDGLFPTWLLPLRLQSWHRPRNTSGNIFGPLLPKGSYGGLLDIFWSFILSDCQLSAAQMKIANSTNEHLYRLERH